MTNIALKSAFAPEQAIFDWGNAPVAPDARKAARTGAFTDNMKLPVHRWFRYSAGFSAEWVADIIRAEVPAEGWLFDPFAGSGTSLLAAQSCGLPSAGGENHPFVVRIAAAKLAWGADVGVFLDRAAMLLERARQQDDTPDHASPLLVKCYTPGALGQLEALRQAFAMEPEADPITALLWLAITAILRECSGAGTAQWQYILPNKSKAKVSAPFEAFARRVEMFAADMRWRQRELPSPAAISLKMADSRSLASFDDLRGQVSMVVTSPPYPNNYDYADATRLEMTFWRELSGWGDLQGKVRQRLIRSCSQHSAAEKLKLDELLASPLLQPIAAELSAVCRELAVVRETKGGKKTYHTMVAAYFDDLARTWHALRPLCSQDAKVCFVIGDSAPYGVHVPAEQWLARLAVAAGFAAPRFDKIRDRNLKWKNRKHRVPLQEGNLWLRGS
ncbi:MAG: hypothetical protein KGN34_01590 [Sphingomonadales bacterium]|nr:hypothetical protein [Sphingomonadales bacterium]